MAGQTQSQFTAQLKKYYSFYTGGFIGFVILLAIAEQMGTVLRRTPKYAQVGGYFVEEVRRQLIEKYGVTIIGLTVLVIIVKVVAAFTAALRDLGYDGVVGMEAWASGDSTLALERFRDAFSG